MSPERALQEWAGEVTMLAELSIVPLGVGEHLSGPLAEVLTTALRARSRHVMTAIRIEDEEGETNKLVRNITSVEEKLGRPLAIAGNIVR